MSNNQEAKGYQRISSFQREVGKLFIEKTVAKVGYQSRITLNFSIKSRFRENFFHQSRVT